MYKGGNSAEAPCAQWSAQIGFFSMLVVIIKIGTGKRRPQVMMVVVFKVHNCSSQKIQRPGFDI